MKITYYVASSLDGYIARDNGDVLEGANPRLSKTPFDAVEEARSQGLKHLWLVGGGKLASAFLESGLLTHLSVSGMPVSLKSGIPLFTDHKLDELSAEKTEIFLKKGFKQLELALRA